MSSYLILTYNVCNMGGAQLYVLRRAKYLIEKGYSVFIVVCFDNGYFPLKDEFGDIPIWCCSEMNKPYVTVKPKEAERIIKEVGRFACIDDGGIIESHTLCTIEWGEIIASSYNCKHLAYPLSETPISNYKWRPGKRVFKDKLIRNELYGLSDASLDIIFGKPCSPNNYVNVGFDEKELCEKCFPLLKINKQEKDYVISTISRLDKTYIEKLIIDTIELAGKYPNQHFILVIAGGSKTGERQNDLFNKYSQDRIPSKNLEIIFTGYITSLGRDLFQMSDVFVGTGLAAINSISQNTVTIVVDETTDLSTGFFGTDTRNFGYGSLEKSCTILAKLEEAYVSNSPKREHLISAGRLLYESEFYTKICFKKLDDAIKRIDNCSHRHSLDVGLVYRFCAYTLEIIKRIIRKLVSFFLR